MKNKLILLIMYTLTLTSCFKDDERIAPYNRGNKQTATIELTKTYKYQVYFNLENATSIATVNKLSYDLMFDASPLGNKILLNTANFMQAARTGKTEFSAVTSANGLTMNFDPSSGNTDSTAIGNWFQRNGSDTLYFREVYVINRGFDDLGNALGLRKIIFDSLKGQTYYFRYAHLNGTNLVSASVTKTPLSHFAYFAFNRENGQVFPEPSKNQYDLLFTQYTTLLYTNAGEKYPYLVTGVLLNRLATGCAVNETMHFDSITRQHAVNFIYSNKSDVIGYDWKRVIGDINTGVVTYQVIPERNYIIRNQNGYYFKLRFIGFYNQLGEKGYPTIEFQRL